MKNYILLNCLLVCISLAQAQESWAPGPFIKTEENPIIRADSSFKFVCPVKKDTVMWQKADVFNPGAIVSGDSICLFVRCEDNPAAELAGRTSRIGFASSKDGIHFTFRKEPVLFPENDAFYQYDYPGGCEDPRVVQTEDGLYVMTYTSWNKKVARLSVAFSKDLHHWEKKGLAFAKAYDGKYKDYWSKSGSIVTRFIGDKQVVAKMNNKYWMYWGEKFVNLAWSENLYDWYPLEENNSLKQVVKSRPGKFDSQLTECGPPAILTDKGIILMFNGKNANNENADPSLPKGTYSVGLALFDSNNPEKLIDRTDTCILKPTLPHEITGQYKAGTTFAEGLVLFKGKWFLYYGTADSFVGLAVTE